MSRNRRAGVFTLVFGGLFLAAVMIAALPSSEKIPAGWVHCGSTYSAAFKSGLDYELDWLNAQIPKDLPPGNGSGYRQLDTYTSPPAGLQAAGMRCASSARVRLVVGEGTVLVLLIAAVVVARRDRSRRDLDV
jgi:hypothetical protein